MVSCNRNMLVWTLENLAENAIKFSPRGETVTIRAAVGTPNGAPKDRANRPALCFSVTDRGPGVPPEERKHIFLKFYQVDRPPKSKGSGFGLYFCRLAVKAHGSRMADAVERTVRVVPDGRKVVRTINGRLEKTVSHEVEIPLDAVCHDGRTGLEVRNAYALLYHRATADAIPPEHPTVPFFCRSGTAGSQTTPCHWVGDTPSCWEAMADALRGCLSLSLSGFPLVAHDAGGFHTPRTIEIPERILDGEAARYTADVDPELFGRWAQWAAFSPVTRFHGTGRREPTAYPEPWRSAAIKALQRRRDIEPLLRAALTEAQRTGMPLMRPTALTHPHDPTARRCWHQYQLGPSNLPIHPFK